MNCAKVNGMRALPFVCVLATTVLLAACASQTATATETPRPPPQPTATASLQSTPSPGLLAGATPDTWVYWLSEVDLRKIASLGPPIAVIDYSRDGTDATAFTSDDLERLRAGMQPPAAVIAYLSIGEAEDYRYYWDARWRSEPPDWLASENPDWPGNYRVHYWNPEWRRIIFGTPESYLDRILAAGFDGAYLDIIDAYEYFAEQGRASAEREMVDLVLAIADYARDRRPGFLVVPQNASALGAHPEYLSGVDGIGVEGVYYGYKEADVVTDSAVTATLEADLERFTNAGKPVLSVDYAASPKNVAAAYERARARGFTPTVTDVHLAGPPHPAPAR